MKVRWLSRLAARDGTGQTRPRNASARGPSFSRVAGPESRRERLRNLLLFLLAENPGLRRRWLHWQPLREGTEQTEGAVRGRYSRQLFQRFVSSAAGYVRWN